MRKKLYLFDLSDLFLNSFGNYNYDLVNNSKNVSKDFPKDNDQNFNKEVEEFETETHKLKKETWISIDGTLTYTRTTSESKKPKVDVSILESELKKAIEQEEYERAAKLRDEIRAIKK
jgi:excinuclease UvrABC helicase subunit UvrB